MQSFLITPDGGKPFMLTARARDVKKWEKRSQRNTLRNMAENPSMDFCYSLAYLALKEQGEHEVPSFDEFVDSYDVLPQPDAVSGPLSYDELLLVIERVTEAEGSSTDIADAVMTMLEDIHKNSMNPTKPGR
jgi:hypothetical protein